MLLQNTFCCEVNLWWRVSICDSNIKKSAHTSHTPLSLIEYNSINVRTLENILWSNSSIQMWPTRNSHGRCSVRKGSVTISFLIKLQAYFTKKETRLRRVPVNFANTFFTEYLWATASGLLARIEKQNMS